MKEYVIWGKAPNEEAETLLVSEKGNISSMLHAQRVVELLTTKHGCKDCRIQVIDLSQPCTWDAASMVNV